MRKVKLRMNEQLKYETIKNFVDHAGNKKRLALKLNISIRQVDRLIIIYKEKGKSGFIHGNRSRKPVKTLDKSISENIILLYNNKYQDWNYKHFKEFLETKEHIYVSYNFIYRTLTKANYLSPVSNRLTRKNHIKAKLLKDKKLNNKTEKEIDIIVNHEVSITDSHPRKEKPKYFGENIEMDGSIHQWFGEHKACLHLACDQSTNTIVGGFFDYYETLNGYYKTKYQILKNYGIPLEFTTDRRTVFDYERLNKPKRTPEKDVLTQFGYSCKQFGIELTTTSIPQAKGLIERDNGTFQGRLINELKLEGITTIEKANEYLINTFIPDFNRRFAMNYKKFESVFETSPSEEKLNYTLAVLTTRKIDNGNAIKFHNKYYQPYLNDILKCFRPKTECLVIKAFNGDLLVSIDNKIFELKELKKNKEYSNNFNETPVTLIKTKKKYIPPMNHPWRVDSFKKQIKKAHTKHVYA